jgi:hypothetical protein
LASKHLFFLVLEQLEQLYKLSLCLSPFLLFLGYLLKYSRPL